MEDFLVLKQHQIILLLYFSLVNILTFFLFALDKMKAEKHKWRISENSLLLISFLGGATGALMAMVIFKHKLSKKKFKLGIPILIILNRIMELLLLVLLN